MTKSTNRAEFRSELIRRFFHPKSHFYSQLRERLDTFAKAGEIKPEDGEVIELLLHRFVHSNDVSAELGTLAHIGRFQGFHQALHDTASTLESSTLDMEGMKVEIQEIARRLAETFRDIFHTAHDRGLVLEWLGLKDGEAVQEPEEDLFVNSLESLELSDSGAEAAPATTAPGSDEYEPGDPREFVSERPDATASTAGKESASEEDFTLPMRLESDDDAPLRPEEKEPSLPEASREVLPGAPDGPGQDEPEEVELRISDDEFRDWLNDMRVKKEDEEAEADESGVLRVTNEDPDSVLDMIDDSNSSAEGGRTAHKTEEVPPVSEEAEPDSSDSDDTFSDAIVLEYREMDHLGLEEASAEFEDSPDLPEEGTEDDPREISHVPSTSSPAEEDLDLEETGVKSEDSSDGSHGDTEDVPHENSDELSDSVSMDGLPPRTDGEAEHEPEASNDTAHTDELTNVFRTEIAGLLDQLERCLSWLESGGRYKGIAQLEVVFEQIRDVSMIHGSGEIEEVATKAWRLCMALDAMGHGLSSVGLSLFKTVSEALSDCLKEKSATSGRHIVALARELAKAEHSLDALVEEPEIERASRPYEGATPAVSEQPPSAVADEDNDVPQEPETTEFQLPGEEDEELRRIIQEVRHDSPPTKADQGEERPEPLAKRPRTVDATPMTPRTAPKQAVARKKPGSGILDRFQAEAELYFSLFDEALSVLKQQPGDPCALEDIELAAYSLKGLCRKLGLDSLAPLPESIEKLASQLNSRKSTLSRDGWLTIFRSVHTLRTIAEDPKERQKTLWALVRTIKHLMQKGAELTAEEAAPKKNRKLTHPWDSDDDDDQRFRLRGRRSRVGAFGY